MNNCQASGMHCEDTADIVCFGGCYALSLSDQEPCASLWAIIGDLDITHLRSLFLRLMTSIKRLLEHILARDVVFLDQLRWILTDSRHKQRKLPDREKNHFSQLLYSSLCDGLNLTVEQVDFVIEAHDTRPKKSEGALNFKGKWRDLSEISHFLRPFLLKN